MNTPLQNRVDPFGGIHAVAERGTMMGNRGIIHDPRTRSLLARRWTTKAWIVCLCAFKGRQRQVMASGSYTELFFVDEASALAAGHRPCFECQRARAGAFARAFAAGCGRERMRAAQIDATLHTERAAAGNTLVTLNAAALETLPEASMIAVSGTAWLLADGRAWPWSFAGYGAPAAIADVASDAVRLITPPSTVAALRSGYRPRTGLEAAA